jgi:hypothetical protein
MTEAEWLSSNDPHALFHHLRWWVRPPERKHRLFACGVCRQCWSLLSDLGRHTVSVAEEAADGHPVDDRPGLEYALLNEHNALRVRRVPAGHPSPEERAALIAYAVIASQSGVEAADDAIRNVPDEAVPVADLIRDVFGNPFRLSRTFGDAPSPTGVEPQMHWRSPLSQHSCGEQVQVRPAVHLTFDRLQPSDLALDGAVTPRRGQRGDHRRLVRPQPGGEPGQLRHPAPARLGHPLGQRGRHRPADHPGEHGRQLQRRVQTGDVTSHPVQERRLLSRCQWLPAEELEGQLAGRGDFRGRRRAGCCRRPTPGLA